MRAKLFSRPTPSPEDAAYHRLATKGYRPRSIVDVGAYEGNWTRLTKKHFPDAQEILCEAQPGKLPKLQEVCYEFRDGRLGSAVIAGQAGNVVDCNEMEAGSSLSPENSNVTRSIRKLKPCTRSKCWNTTRVRRAFWRSSAI